MSIGLQYSTIRQPQWRILHAVTWGYAWKVLPTTKLTRGNWSQGYFVEEFWRSCIPEPGQAVIRYNTGQIDDTVYGTVNDGIDLRGQYIRIQVAPDDGSGTEPAWKTVWVGVVEHQEDVMAPGSEIFQGQRKYYCLDLLASVTMQQPMNRHGMVINTDTFYIPAFGHPGYNGKNWDGRILGNKEATGVKWYDQGASFDKYLPWAQDNLSDADKALFRAKLFCHAPAGVSTAAGAIWTDLQAVEHALASSRLPNTPYFYVAGSTSLLSNTNAWPVEEAMSAWDFLSEMFKRQRGRGLAFLDWADDTSAPTGPLTPYITINPQTAADITYTEPGASSASTIEGAATATTTATVDLEGDHRNISATFTLGDRNQHVYGYVESVGERIEVLATLDYLSNSLESRWSSTDASNMVTNKASSVDKVRGSRRYEAVYQLHGLSKTWNGTVGNGNSATPSKADYRCNDDGTITTGYTTPLDTSPAMVTMMSDLPLYVGYNYAATPVVRFDTATETLAPDRLKPLILVRTASDRYVRADQTPYDCSISVSDYGIQVEHVRDVELGTRYFSGLAGGLGGTLSKTVLVCTVCLQMPHRVRMASGNPYASRKKQIFHKGLHLWLANPDAIWDLSTATITASTGAAGLRNAAPTAGGGPGLLRDDRTRLAREHAMAAAWYMTPRRTASWQLKSCGFLPGFYQTDLNDNPTSTLYAYRHIGQLVTTLQAGGELHTLNTPITKVHFTNRGNGITTWITDWSDLDLR